MDTIGMTVKAGNLDVYSALGRFHFGGFRIGSLFTLFKSGLLPI